jgi:putative transposase
MRKTFKYRIYANKKTIDRAMMWLNFCRNLYNIALGQRISIHRQNHGHISCYDQMKQLPELKVAFPEYREVGSQVLQDVLERLDKAYQAFFRRVKNGSGKAGFPRFKGRDRYDSFTLKQCGWKIEGKYLTITKIGKFKLRLSRSIQGDIKTVTICRESTGKWYACFSCDSVPEKKLPAADNMVGIDVGIKSFLVDSDGGKVDNPHYLKHSLKLLRVRQRKLCRRAKGSNRRKKARLLVAEAHEKVTNQRNDFLHKTANYYVANYGVICIEDLNIKGMVRNHNLAKPINDVSWGKFFELLSCKAEEAGRKVIKVPRFEPSSKMCSVCGAINQDLTLNDRQWICRSCGTLHDRDYNAAKNICRVGQTLQEPTYEIAQCVS